jgi:hypothetical protein
MWEISSGQPAFINHDHNCELAMKIVNGMRPKILSDTPLEYSNLMEQCCPSERPDIDRLYNKIFEMRNLYYQDGSNKLYNEPFHK